MIDAIHIAAAGLRANEVWLETISGNIANINTPAFKARSVDFQSAVQSQAEAVPDATVPQLVRAEANTPELTTGDIRQTGRELDVAINGRGFLRVVDADGNLAYTRHGRLMLNDDGVLATSNGWTLADDIRIPPDATAIDISTQGDVIVKLPDHAQPVLIGSVLVANINSVADLTEISAGYYRHNNALQQPDAQRPGSAPLGELQQGHLEFANVDLVKEMSQLVLAQRAYQLNARVLQIGDHVLDTINNLRR